jgi:hypothetical protein
MLNIIVWVILIGALAIYIFTPWLNGISFIWWAAAVALAIILDFGLTYRALSGDLKSLASRFWRMNQYLILIFVGVLIFALWLPGKIGRGPIFMLGVVCWVAMVFDNFRKIEL